MNLLVLGPPKLQSINGEAPLRQMEALLLTYLAEHSRSRFLSRETIASKIWPTSRTARSLRSLSQLIYQIREKAPFLGFEPHSKLVVHAPLHSDLEAFRTAVREGRYFAALGLFRGPLLGGAHHESTDLTAWLDGLRSEVNAGLEVALDHCAVHASTGQERTILSIAAESAISTGSALPSALRARVVACLAEGDHTRADTYYRLLKEEDENCPPKETLAQLLNPPGIPQEQQKRAVRFIGRDAELQILHDSWRRALAGDGNVVVVRGEPGIGKTRLADQFLRKVALGGGRVWLAHCMSATKRLPYAALSQLWREHIAPHRKEYSDLEPQFRCLDAVLHSNTGVPSDLSEQTRYRVLDATITLIERISADRPLAILVDDVQWADDLTAQLLVLCALRIAHRKVMLLLTLRSADVEPEPLWIEDQLASAQILTLGQLTIESASDLVRAFEASTQCTVPAAVKNLVLWQAAGRPLLIIEGLAAASSDMPDSDPPSGVFLPQTAEMLLKRRFRDLSTEAIWLYGILAVLGRAEQVCEVPRMSGFDDRVTAAALDVLCSRGILEVSSGRVGFPHDLMREVAYRYLAPGTRMLLHRRAAELLGDSADYGLLAQHYAEAGDGDKAGAFALRSAERAMREGRYRDCEYFFQLAVQVGSEQHKASAARQYSLLLAQTGRWSAIEALLPWFESQYGREALLLRRLLAAERAIVSGQADVGEIVERATDVVRMLETIEATNLALAFSTLLNALHESSSLERSGEFAENLRRAAATSTNVQFRRQVEAILALWDALALGFRPGHELLSQSSSAIEEQYSPFTNALVTFAEGTILYFSGRLREAKAVLGRSLALAQSVDDLRRANATSVNASLVLMELGELNEARRHLEAVLSSPDAAHRLAAYGNLAILYFEEGADHLVHRTLQTIERVMTKHSSVRYASTAAALRGLILVRSQQWREAVDLFQAHEELALSAPQGDLAYSAPFAAHVLASSGRSTDALVVLERAIERMMHRDRICELRLRLARADVLTRIDVDRAFAEARAVQKEAVAIGAALIERDARALVERTRV